MFSSLKHTFQSIEDHFHKLFEHVEARYSMLKETAESESEKIADEIRQEFLDLRSDFFSLRKRVENLEHPNSAPTAVSLPHVVHVPIPEESIGSANPEVVEAEKVQGITV